MKVRISWIIQILIYCGLFIPINGIADNQIRCDSFSITAKINDRTLTYNLETDLPDNANVIVSISRAYNRRNTQEVYSEDYYNSKKTIGQLRLINIVKIDDNLWCQTLAKQQKLMEKARLPFDVDKIDDSIYVSITFHINQDDPMFGKNNQNVFGKMIDGKTPIRAIRTEKKIYLPLTVKYDSSNFPKENITVKPIPSPTTKPTKSKYISADKTADNRHFTNGGQIACFVKSDVEDMVTFSVAKDKASFESYIKRKKCFVLKDGIEVTIMEYPGMFGGYTKFAYQGIMVWTMREGIKW